MGDLVVSLLPPQVVFVVWLNVDVQRMSRRCPDDVRRMSGDCPVDVCFVVWLNVDVQMMLWLGSTWMSSGDAQQIYASWYGSSWISS